MPRPALAIGLALCLLAAHARAQEPMYGCGGNGSDAPGVLFLVDPTTGAQTEIGDPVTPGGLSGITFDALGNLYGSTIQGSGTTSTLVRIDPATGALLQTIGAITVPSEGPISIGDLAFEPGTQTLWAIRSQADDQQRGGEIYTLDPTTAVATLQGAVPGTDAASLAFGPDGSLFQGAGFPGTSTQGVQRLDPDTLDVLDTRAFATFFDGLAVRPSDGTLFATGDGGVHRLDFAAGTQATLFPGPSAGSMSDLAFLPEPDGWAAGLAALAALGLASRRGGRIRHGG